MQINLLGAHQEITFLFLFLAEILFFFVANKKSNNNKCGENLNDIKFNGTTVSRKELNYFLDISSI